MTLVASDTRRPAEPLVAGARPPRSAPDRRPAGPTDASGKNRTFRRWFLGSGLYSLTLGYDTPKSFFAVAPDSWPGDPVLGQRLLIGELLARGSAGGIRLLVAARQVSKQTLADQAQRIHLAVSAANQEDVGLVAAQDTDGLAQS